ncbi:MAG: hypothetical protein KGM47_12095 [Acidobacteriota bacterium]|nr:hypothetical protein [Acidobacteriota bacterium]
MTYTPAWSAAFSKPLLNQIIAIIQRDQASAIALVNPALAPMNEFHKGPGPRTALPWLTLAADQTDFDVSSPWTRAWHTAVTLTLDAGQFDQEFAQDNAQDYARVLDMIITTASGSDWMTPLPVVHETVPGGITVPPEAGSVKEVFVASHRYSVAAAPNLDVPVMRAVLNVVFRAQET